MQELIAATTFSAALEEHPESEAAEVMPNLWVGSKRAAGNLQWLAANAPAAHRFREWAALASVNPCPRADIRPFQKKRQDGQ